jgi:hypothetical protein
MSRRVKRLLALLGSSVLEQVPAEGQQLWLDAGSGIELGSDVTAWRDRSPAGNDAVEFTESQRPAFLPTGGPNGRPGVQFVSASNDRLVIPTINVTSNDLHAFAALDVVALLQQSCIIRQAPPFICISNRTDIIQVGGYDGVAWRNVAVATTGVQVLEWIWDSGALTIEVLRDGVSLGTAPYDGTAGIAGATVCALSDVIASEIMLYDRILEPGEAGRVRAYLADKYL